MLNVSGLDRAWIASHIPHRGSMCLLAGVETWNRQHIQCRASSHRDADNPLRSGSRLGAACGIEYAAQTMAVHGVLLAPPGSLRARAAYLASVRETQLLVLRLDDISADLVIDAHCIMSSVQTSIYDFSITAEGKLLLHGRAAVVLGADKLTPASGVAP